MEFKKNDIATVEITDMGHDGEGIGKIGGYTVFVKDALIGDVVEAKIIKPGKQYAFARLEKVLAPSSFRVKPECACHRQCGGCQIQALSYEKQLEFKQNKIRNNLLRIGKLEEAVLDRVMEPIIGMQEPYHYRNKAQFPIGTDKEGNPIAGFYAGRTHSIIANTDCVIGAKENKRILELILQYMRAHGVPAYDEASGTGLVRHVLIRKGFATGEIMVCLVINAGELPAAQKLIGSLKNVTGVSSISISINRERTNAVMGKEIHTLWGKDTIADEIQAYTVKTAPDFTEFVPSGRKLSFHISPLSFYQVNPIQAERLYSLALAYAGLTGRETVWDLYCGIGTISLFLAQDAKMVYGVEVLGQAVCDARENAKRNGIGNVQFFAGKAEETLPELYEKKGIWADVIVVDPPRKGCDEKCLETILRMQPKRVVYISCDSATLARDLKQLCAGGYALERVRGCDMFPMTGHVETVVKLSLKTNTSKIEVTMKPNDESNYTPAEKGTYQNIKDYIWEKYGLKVHTLYIAQIKDKCGLDKEHYGNGRARSEDAKVPKCPPEKEAAIMDAFRHFGMI